LVAAAALPQAFVAAAERQLKPGEAMDALTSLEMICPHSR